MSHQYIIQSPDTCGYIFNPLDSSYQFFDTPDTVIACSDNFSEFYSFATKEECYASLLQIDPSCSKNIVYGSLPIIFSTIPDSTDTWVTAPSGTVVTLEANISSPEAPDATSSYTWFENHNGIYSEVSIGPILSITSTGISQKFQVRANISGAFDWTNQASQVFNINY